MVISRRFSRLASRLVLFLVLGIFIGGLAGMVAGGILVLMGIEASVALFVAIVFGLGGAVQSVVTGWRVIERGSRERRDA